MGIPVIFVCSPCNDDFDCGAGTCVLPEIVIDGDYFSLESGYCA